MFLIASNGLITELMRLGFGMTLQFVPHMHTLSTTSDVISKVGLGLSKTSFAVTLLRFSEGWQRWFIWFLIFTMNGLLATNAVTTWMGACDREGDAYEAVLPACWRVEDSVIMAMVANGELPLSLPRLQDCLLITTKATRRSVTFVLLSYPGKSSGTCR